MEATPTFQQFVSEQLAAACGRIVAEYERLQDEAAPAAKPAARAEGGNGTFVDVAQAVPCDTLRTASKGAAVPAEITGSQSVASAAFGAGPSNATRRGSRTSRTSRSTSDTDSLTPPERRKSDRSIVSGRHLRVSSKSCSRIWANDGDGAAYIFDPSASWYRTWQTATALIVVFSIFFTPVRFAFQYQSSWATYLDYCIDVLFGFDILLTFNVAGTTKDGHVWDRWRIFRSYVASSRFWIDIGAVLPLSECALLLGASPRAADALNLLRLLRANRILLLFRELQKNVYLNLMGVVVAKFVLFIVLCTHTAGCVFYALASHSGFGEDTWVSRVDPELPRKPWHTIYVHMIYWAVGTYKAGPAHGPIFPASEYEMLLSCAAMMTNIFLQTYLVSSMAALLTTADVRIYAMRTRLTQLAEFSQRYRLTPEMSAQIRSYIRFKFSTNQELDQNVLGGLPEIYRQRISHTLYAGLLSRLLIFNGCRTIFLKQLHGALDSLMHMEGHELVRVDDPSTELQILAEGEVAVYYEDQYIEARFGGECIAAVPFICKVSHSLGVRTRRVCRILSLHRVAWDAASASFPEDVGQVKANLLSECHERRDLFEAESPGALAYQRLTETLELHAAQQGQDAISSLCFAAASGDTAKIKRILRTHPAACADYDNRSPLHVAASKGQTAALELLIYRKANVNMTDNFGRTPLMEALRSKQEAAAQCLHEHGATLGYSVHQPSRHGAHSEQGPGGPPEPPQWASEQPWASESASMHAQAAELCEAASDPQMLWYLSALIRYGASVNASDYDARTPLHVASAAGNRMMLEILLDCEDIDTSPLDRFGRTPLMEAVRHRHEPCARLLRSRGASHGFSVSAKLDDDTHRLHAGQELCQAAFANETMYLHSLVTNCGLAVDTADYDFRTALMLACAEGNTDAAVTLVQLGADVHRKDRWGHTALTEARDHGHTELVTVLKQLHAARKAPGRRGAMGGETKHC